MSFSNYNTSVIFILSLILIYFTAYSGSLNSYLGRTLLVASLILLTWCNILLGIFAVGILAISYKFRESFATVEQLFDQQNSLQKKVYYVPKRKEAPVPQNDTDYVPLNPMQSKAGAIQPSQPAPVSIVQPNKQKTTGNNYHNLLRIEDTVRPKSSKTLGSDMGIQTGLNKDYEPESNWPDENAFKNPYSAAENE
jgi:hypothetical protein